MKFSKHVLLPASMFLFFFPAYGYAYIDPGAGSSIFQSVVASLVVGFFVAKTAWGKIKMYLGRIIIRKKQKKN
ncbi:MAG: hypothetical protein WC695_03270 [Candidatus Omnitrophota bacterium]